MSRELWLNTFLKSHKCCVSWLLRGRWRSHRLRFTSALAGAARQPRSSRIARSEATFILPRVKRSPGPHLGAGRAAFGGNTDESPKLGRATCILMRTSLRVKRTVLSVSSGKCF